MPKYLSTDRILSCPTVSSTSTARPNADYRHQLQKNKDLLIENKFHNLTSLKSKLSTVTLPTGYSACLNQDSVEFYYVQRNDSDLIAPKIGVCLTISKALELLVYVKNALVVKSSYGHVSKADKLTTVTELTNILAFCKMQFKKSTPTVIYRHALLISLITLLKELCSALLKSDSWFASSLLIRFIMSN